MKSLIYDFETLGTNHAESAVVSLAALVFDSSHFKEGYTYDELLDTVITVKFDVKMIHTISTYIDDTIFLADL